MYESDTNHNRSSFHIKVIVSIPIETLYIVVSYL